MVSNETKYTKGSFEYNMFMVENPDFKTNAQTIQYSTPSLDNLNNFGPLNSSTLPSAPQ